MKKRLPLLTAVLFGSLVAPLSANAESASDWVVEKQKESFTVEEGTTVDVANGDTAATVTIRDNGKVVEEKKIDLTKVTEVHKLSDNRLAVVYRADGSGQSLFFDVYNTDTWEKVYGSDAYERANFKVDGGKIAVDYPTFDEDAISTEPSAIVTDTFTLDGGEVKKEAAEDKISAQSATVKAASTSVNEKYKNPSYAEINRMLTDAAEEFDMPPEVVKAIAFQESGWQQYWDPGRTPVSHYQNSCTSNSTTGTKWDGTNVKLGYDCIGIGIMQVSDYRFIEDPVKRQEEVTKLSTDINYNIREGLKILDQKWKYANSGLIPTVNNADRDVIENWYFAILAYNGLSSRNHPIDSAYVSYQDKVYDRMRSYGLFPVTPLATQELNPRIDGILKFEKTNVTIDNPVHTSKAAFTKGQKVYVTAGSLNMRSTPNGVVRASLKRGDALTVTGPAIGSNSNTQHWMWYPVRTSSGMTGYVASSYLSENKEPRSVELAGKHRYDTSASLSNFGWHWDKPKVAVLGRGDLPIDSLTGSVLASYYDSPLLLTQPDILPEHVEKELRRMNPDKIYLLGGEGGAISAKVENQLKSQFGNVVRLSGDTRYGTAYEIADELTNQINVDEIFVTTADAESPDALSIASYAGQAHTPILLTGTNDLDEETSRFIKENGVKKVTIIGGTNAVSSRVESQLKSQVGTVERVSGSDRFSTSVKIAEKYFGKNMENVFFARGHIVVDALSASPLAAKMEAPIILTRTDAVPSTVSGYLKGLNIAPKLYYLGGDAAISGSTRSKLESYR
ncbi:UNVERIFIED_CONTAM: cell wall-binding repeat-containing protein [Halobacillus marinus]